MNQITTEAIVLGRINYGEADRIITMLTPEHGKLRLMAKGVRRVKSKLAGGIELFSVSTITFVPGRGDIGTLVSTRLRKHYGSIVKDLARTQLGYIVLKQIDTVTEDQPDSEYFELLEHIFDSLDSLNVSLPLVRSWFGAQLLRLGGHMPELQRDVNGAALQPDASYAFDFDMMALKPAGAGKLQANHIKLLRLLFSESPPAVLAKIAGADQLLTILDPVIITLLREQGIV